VRQLERTAALPGVRLAVGLPDLHPGKGHPVGAAFLVDGHVYPTLVGSDIGCGMALLSTDVPVKKARRDRWADKLRGLERPWDGDRAAWLAQHGTQPTPFDDALGTVGGGNHFVEIQAFDRVEDGAAVAAAGLDPECLVVLVHSGSRGLGESILRAHAAAFGDGGLADSSAEAHEYIARHDAAVAWARANRALLGLRLCEQIGAEGTPVLDLVHNSVVRHAQGWLHRKGAAPSDAFALVPIPGSRGTHTVLVAPTGDGERSAWSLAHGAGRKWRRSDARGRLEDRFSPRDLEQTPLGGRVICEDKDLLYEEAPQAYKDIDQVVQDLVSADLVRVIATLRPLVSYKTRSRDR